MNHFFTRAIVLFLILGGLIAGASALPTWMDSGSEILIHPILHAFNLAYLIITLLSHRMLIQSNEKAGAAFTTAFMGIVTVKLLFTMAALGLWLYFVKDGRVSVAIGVFVLYMSYTIYEVAYLQKVLRK